MTDKCKVVRINTASEVPLQPLDGKPTLVYWDIVGIVHPIRMALALAGIEWYDVRLVCGRTDSNTSQSNKKEWFQVKKVLREKNILNFPNLPYFLDDDVKLVQTDAILRYVCTKYNLMGTGEEVPHHITDMLMEEARDLDSMIVQLSYEEGSEAVAKWLCCEELREKLQVWDDMIQKSGGVFVTGTTISVVDLKFFTFLYKFQHAQARLVSMEFHNKVPPLPFFVPAYMQKVKKASPHLEACLDSPDMEYIPINNPHARFDNY